MVHANIDIEIMKWYLIKKQPVQESDWHQKGMGSENLEERFNVW